MGLSDETISDLNDAFSGGRGRLAFLAIEGLIKDKIADKREVLDGKLPDNSDMLVMKISVANGYIAGLKDLKKTILNIMETGVPSEDSPKPITRAGQTGQGNSPKE